jgi:MFS family permease
VAHTTRSELQSMITDLIEGVRYAFVKQQVILDLIIAAALYSFGMSAFSTLFPILGKTMLGLGPAEIGYLWSSLGIGLFVVSLALIRMSDWTVSGRITAIALSSVLTAVAMCGLIFTSNRVIAGMLLCLIGAGIGLFTPVAWGVLQEIAPQGMVGRLLTLYGAVAMAAAMIGMTFLSWIMQKVGESLVVAAIAFVLLITAAMAWRLSRRVTSSLVQAVIGIAIVLLMVSLTEAVTDKSGTATTPPAPVESAPPPPAPPSTPPVVPAPVPQPSLPSNPLPLQLPPAPIKPKPSSPEDPCENTTRVSPDSPAPNLPTSPPKAESAPPGGVPEGPCLPTAPAPPSVPPSHNK